MSTINTFEYQYSKNSSGNKILLSKYLEIGVAEKNAAQGVFETRDEAVAAAADNLVAYDTYTRTMFCCPQPPITLRL